MDCKKKKKNIFKNDKNKTNQNQNKIKTKSKQNQNKIKTNLFIVNSNLLLA